MGIKDLWSQLRGYMHIAWSTFRHLTFKGWSRDGSFYSVSFFRFEVRRWKVGTPRWAIILWWPKLYVIKGTLERPKNE